MGMLACMKDNTTAAKPHEWPAELIDLERLIGLGEAAGLIRRWSGQPTNPSTLFRWCQKGRLDIRLPHIRLGRHIRTTEAALRWWLAETTAAQLYDAAPANRPRRPPVMAEGDLQIQLEAEGL